MLDKKETPDFALTCFLFCFLFLSFLCCCCYCFLAFFLARVLFGYFICFGLYNLIRVPRVRTVLTLFALAILGIVVFVASNPFGVQVWYEPRGAPEERRLEGFFSFS